MYQLLKKGSELTGRATQKTYRVTDYLGSGGQGEVYEAQAETGSRALKWYYENMATQEQLRILEDLVRRGPPNHRFLWPEEIVTFAGQKGYGYVMPLREPRYKGVHDLLAGKASPSYEALTTAAYNLVDAFLQLHTSGLSYRDINDGGVLFDYANGDVVICDNDNVYVNGLGDAGVKGKMRWMAPEIVRNEASPSTDTDLYSLSVLLFFMLIVHHPLEGAKESAIRSLDMKAMHQLYGTAPVFIFDPDDRSNRPTLEFHRNAVELWPNYPMFLRRLFVRAFTEGLKDPIHGRVRENEWRKALSKLRDSLFRCSQCGSEQFFDAEVQDDSRKCTECRGIPATPHRMRFEGTDIVFVVSSGRRLYEHHLLTQRDYRFEVCLAEVVAKPGDPSSLGLRNMTADTWLAKTPTNEDAPVPPGKTIALTSGTRVNFGQRVGVVRA
jgi:DNA-binding helix-hairpin-helix protein with protein kinase domain